MALETHGMQCMLLLVFCCTFTTEFCHGFLSFESWWRQPGVEGVFEFCSSSIGGLSVTTLLPVANPHRCLLPASHQLATDFHCKKGRLWKIPGKPQASPVWQQCSPDFSEGLSFHPVCGEGEVDAKRYLCIFELGKGWSCELQVASLTSSWIFPF